MNTLAIVGAIILGFGVLIYFVSRSHGSNAQAIADAAASLKTHITGEIGDARQRIQIATVAAVQRVAPTPAPVVSDSQLAPIFVAPPLPAPAVFEPPPVEKPAPPPAPEPAPQPVLPEQTMRVTPTFINVVGNPGADGSINVPWPVYPNVGTIVTAPSVPRSVLRFRFTAGGLKHPVGRMEFAGTPEATAWRVSLLDSSGVKMREPAAYFGFTVDADPPQADWLRLNSGAQYEVVCERITDEVANDPAQFHIYT